MRNNVSQPTTGHVIMFAATTVGWLVLFLITVATPAAGPTWWVKAAFSGVLLLASGVFTALLWWRVARRKKAG